MNQPDVATALSPVISAFEHLQVPFYIGGSIASSAHGEFRATADADIVADLKVQDVDTFVQWLGNAYYADADAIRDSIIHRISFNVLHHDTFLKIDVFPLKSRPYDQEAMRRRMLKGMGGQVEDPQIYVSPPEDIGWLNWNGIAWEARCRIGNGVIF